MPNIGMELRVRELEGESVKAFTAQIVGDPAHHRDEDLNSDQYGLRINTDRYGSVRIDTGSARRLLP